MLIRGNVPVDFKIADRKFKNCLLQLALGEKVKKLSFGKNCQCYNSFAIALHGFLI